MTPGELRRLTRFARWHLAYVALVAAFFSLLYATGAFRSSVFLMEKFIFLVMAPAATVAFVLISPWRGDWRDAITGMYQRLEGQEAFIVMALLVFLFGFLVYSVLIWGLGALIPSLFYM
jgi:4-hydroxybenzoate polyprenyltransferase